MSFGGKERAFKVRRSAKAAELTARGDHTMVGKSGLRGFAKDVAHRARGAGPARQTRNITVGRDAARGNRRHNPKHAAAERCGSFQRTITGAVRASASVSARPSARASVMPERTANVGARSAGVALVRYRPGVMPNPMSITGTR
jgi:hypothetical protein